MSNDIQLTGTFKTVEHPNNACKRILDYEEIDKYKCTCTLQLLYNMVYYYTVLDIIWFKDGSQKCIDYIEK